MCPTVSGTNPRLGDRETATHRESPPSSAHRYRVAGEAALPRVCSALLHQFLQQTPMRESLGLASKTLVAIGPRSHTGLVSLARGAASLSCLGKYEMILTVLTKRGAGACPRCAGDRREPLAPNLYRCTSGALTEIVETLHVGFEFPWGGGQPIYERRVRQDREQCGNEYQEGVPMLENIPTCDCGTFAVGVCIEDREPVCGSHSNLTDDGKRRCDTHRTEFDRAAKIARARQSSGLDQPSRPDSALPAGYGICRECATAVPLRNQEFAEFHRPGEAVVTTFEGPTTCEGSNRRVVGAV